MLAFSLKKRNFSDSNNKKAQSNIAKNLDRAYTNLKNKGLKDLEKHLRNNIKPDGRYGYQYIGNFKWDIEIK